MDCSDKIRIIFINNQPLIWNANDFLELKTKHRVCVLDECLLGVPPGGVGQTTDSSLPALLMKPEAHMLISKGYAYACKFPQLSEMPDVDQKNNLNMLERHINTEQLNEISDSTDKINFSSIEKFDRKHLHLKKSDRELIMQLYVEHPLINGLKEQLFSWNYPDTEKEKLICNVYYNLHARGWHIASGLTYGADFVLYRDLPTLCHGVYLILCKLETEKIHSLDIIVHARVADTTNKELYFASQDETGRVYYSGLTWTGISTFLHTYAWG